jgi:hypothetical protein
LCAAENRLVYRRARNRPQAGPVRDSPVRHGVREADRLNACRSLVAAVLAVIASEAKQSQPVGLYVGDCRVAALLAMTGQPELSAIHPIARARQAVSTARSAARRLSTANDEIEEHF